MGSVTSRLVSLVRVPRTRRPPFTISLMSAMIVKYLPGHSKGTAAAPWHPIRPPCTWAARAGKVPESTQCTKFVGRQDWLRRSRYQTADGIRKTKRWHFLWHALNPKSSASTNRVHWQWARLMDIAWVDRWVMYHCWLHLITTSLMLSGEET